MEGKHIEFAYNLQNRGRTTLKSVALSKNQNLISGFDKQCIFNGEDGDIIYSTASTPNATGGSTTCTTSYTITQDDIEHGSITLIADASAKAGSSNTDVTATRSLTLNLLQQPLLFISMSFEHVFAVLRNPKVGDKISFTLELENKGNVFWFLRMKWTSHSLLVVVVVAFMQYSRIHLVGAWMMTGKSTLTMA